MEKRLPVPAVELGRCCCTGVGSHIEEFELLGVCEGKLGFEGKFGFLIVLDQSMVEPRLDCACVCELDVVDAICGRRAVMLPKPEAPNDGVDPDDIGLLDCG